jgi:hypothetical protein
VAVDCKTVGATESFAFGSKFNLTRGKSAPMVGNRSPKAKLKQRGGGGGESSGTDGNVRLCSLLDVATARCQSRRGKRLMEVTSYWCWTDLESSATTLTGPARSRTILRARKKIFALHTLRTGKRTNVKFAQTVSLQQ